MTGPAQARHDGIVRALTERYRSQGYTVQREVSLRDVSGDDVTADLVVTKGPESILVEVRLVTSARSEPKLRRLSEIAHDRGWKFVIVIAYENNFEEVEVASPHDIQKVLLDVDAVAQRSTPSAALLAWSAFEAAARLYLTRTAGRLTRPVQPQTLIQQLAALGAVDVQEEQLLTRFAQQRNRFAHGAWSTDEPVQLKRVVEIAARLVESDPLPAAG